ncbi:MAG: RNA methyltransferase, partial [Bacteroidaceae bacterium]|nr:RNA methyltransferase [Bacteroidaceae bacterium]
MMNEIEIITSVHNPRIRQLLLLQQKSAERRKAGMFVVEGRRELQHCIDAGFEIDTVFYSEELGISSE